MMKKELLSPVGNFESLLSAIHNGADAVYLGGKKFGARAFADNFNEEEMVRAIQYSHLYGVKIYVTVNTMIYEREIESCINYIRFLHQNNVDAIIMQDLGLIKLVREKFPNLEIHASTQMHNHNEEQLKLLENLGIKRVVLARELSLEEIEKLNTNMEIEAFIHGALCISYSGQCLFSSLLMDRSGNRGSCAGICRLPFKLLENETEIKTNGKYLLSPKEFCTIDHFKEIMESNIYSLKIEGRMKSPEYVGFVTKLYRTLIDNYEGGKLNISENQRKNLASLFNRGFTNGHLFHATDEDLMNPETSNHQGIFLGEVLSITKDKIKIKLQEDLHQEDGIRFSGEDKGLIVNFLYNEKGLLVHSVLKGNVCFVDNKIGLKTKGNVLKTIDSVLMRELKRKEEKKILVTCQVEAFVGSPLKLNISDGIHAITCSGVRVDKATHHVTTKEIIEEKINSLGNTPFKIEQMTIKMDDDIFLSMSELKKLRREVVEELIKARENKIPHPFLENEIVDHAKNEEKGKTVCFINVLVRNEEQLLTCLEENVSTIYVTKEELYRKYKTCGNIYLRLPRVIQNFKEYKEEKLLVGETGSLYKYGNTNEVITDYYLNVANRSSIKFLESFNAKKVTLSIENKKEDIESILKNIENKENVEVYLYGKPEVMIMKYCPLKMHVNKKSVCLVCKNENRYYLKDRNEKLYRILTEPSENHLTHLFYYKNMDWINEIKAYQKLGIQNFRVEFLDESASKMKLILRKIGKCQI